MKVYVACILLAELLGVDIAFWICEMKNDFLELSLDFESLFKQNKK